MCIRDRYPVRLIKALRKEDNSTIVFITNIEELKAVEITEIYKTRWDIEVFFKFLKQHLNFSHLLNRTENGIKVIMYATMIAAILLTEFKRKKSLEGFKIPKRKFAQALENEILINFVVLCNGNPEIARKIIYPDTS